MNKMRSIALILLALVTVAPTYTVSPSKPAQTKTRILKYAAGSAVGALAIAAAVAAIATRTVDCGQVAQAFVCDGQMTSQLNRLMCAKQIANIQCPIPFTWF